MIAASRYQPKVGTHVRGLAVSCFCLIVLGCATKEDLQGVRTNLENSIAAAKKEMKTDLDAAKKQSHDETQQAVDKVKVDVGAVASKTLKDMKEQQDAASTQAKTQDERLSKELEELRQQHQQLVQQVVVQQDTLVKMSAALKNFQAQMIESQKTDQQMLREFQGLRTGVQLTYGGVLDFLRVEEALLQASLQRVQTILHGVQGSEGHAQSPSYDQKPTPAGTDGPGSAAPQPQTSK
jgi:hypothetical protein